MAEPNNVDAMLGQFWDQAPPKAVGDAFAWLNQILSELPPGGLLAALGRWIESGDVAADKAAQEGYTNLLKKLNLTPEQWAFASNLAPNTSTADSPGGIGNLIKGTLVEAGAEILSLRNVFTKLAQEGSRISPSELPDVQTLLLSGWRSGFDAVHRDLFDRMGYHPATQRVIRQGTKPYHTTEEIFRLAGIGNWDDKILMGELAKLGWFAGTKSTRKKKLLGRLKILFQGQPDLQMALEMRRRGMITDNGLDGIVGRLSLGEMYQKAARELYHPLLTPASLAEIWRRGKLTDAQYHHQLRKLGYEDKLRDGIDELKQRLLDPQDARTAVWRGLINITEYDDLLKKYGYNDDDRLTLQNVTWLRPPPSDLIRFGVREVYSKVIRTKFKMDEGFPVGIVQPGRDVGLREEDMRNYWAAHWDLPAPDQGFRMFHRDIIDEGELKMLLRALDVMPFWRDKLIQLTYKLIPRRMIPRLVRQGIFKEAETHAAFKKLGYEDKNALSLTESAVKQAAEKEKLLSKTEILDAFALGMMDENTLRGYLAAIGYGDDEINYYVVKAWQKLENNKEYKNATNLALDADEAKNLTKSEILKSYRLGISTQEAAGRLLANLGYDKRTRDFLVAIEDLRKKSATLADQAKQYKRQYDAGLISPTQAAASLVTTGSTPGAAAALVGKWSLERNTDLAIAAIRDRQPTRADIKDWLVKGIIEPQKWVEYMTVEGYGDNEIRFYLEEILIDNRE